MKSVMKKSAKKAFIYNEERHKDSIFTVVYAAKNFKVFLIFWIKTRNFICLKEHHYNNVTTVTRKLRIKLN